MKRKRLILVSAAVTFLAGCVGAPTDATVPHVRLRNDAELNCNMDQSKCDIIRAGIQYLLDHKNTVCKNVGAVALGRFEAPAATGNGYQEASQIPGIDMGVRMQAGSSYSGGVPVDGKVDVYPSFWTNGFTDEAHTGALLAHEEQHQNGYDWNHNTGVAMNYQTTCLNPQA